MMKIAIFAVLASTANAAFYTGSGAQQNDVSIMEQMASKDAMMMQSRLYGAEFRKESRDELGKDYYAYMGADLNAEKRDLNNHKMHMEFEEKRAPYNPFRKWPPRPNPPAPPQYAPYAIRLSKRVANKISATWYTPNNTASSYQARMSWGTTPVLSTSGYGTTYSWYSYVDSPKVHVASTNTISCSGCTVYYKVGSTVNGWGAVNTVLMPGTGYPTSIVATTDLNLGSATDVAGFIEDACDSMGSTTLGCFFAVAGDSSHGTGVYAGSTVSLEGELDAGHTALSSFTASHMTQFTNGNWERWMDGISYEGRFGHSHYPADSGSSTHTAYSTILGAVWLTVFCTEVDYTQWGSSNRFQEDDWGSCEIPFEDSSGTVYNSCTTVGWSQPWCGIFHTWWTGSLTSASNLEDCAAASNTGIYSFVDSDLTAYGSSSSDWNIVMTHRPMYCSSMLWCPFSDNLVDEIEPLMTAAGTDFMIAGHTHTYERTHTVDDWVSGGSDLTAPDYPIHVAVLPTVNPSTSGYNNNVNMPNPTCYAMSCPAMSYYANGYIGWGTGSGYGWACSNWLGVNWIAQAAGASTFLFNNASSVDFATYDYQTASSNSQSCSNAACPPSGGAVDSFSLTK